MVEKEQDKKPKKTHKETNKKDQILNIPWWKKPVKEWETVL